MCAHCRAHSRPFPRGKANVGKSFDNDESSVKNIWQRSTCLCDNLRTTVADAAAEPSVGLEKSWKNKGENIYFRFRWQWTQQPGVFPTNKSKQMHHNQVHKKLTFNLLGSVIDDVELNPLLQTFCCIFEPYIRDPANDVRIVHLQRPQRSFASLFLCLRDLHHFFSTRL